MPVSTENKLDFEFTSHNDISGIPDVLLIIHLDDSFLQSRINMISNLINIPTVPVAELFRHISNVENKKYSGNIKTILEGMVEITSLVKKVKDKIVKYTFRKPDISIFLLNFINTSNSKMIYSPCEDKIVEIGNSNNVFEKNLEQAKFFIEKLYQQGLLPYRRLTVEIVGVYRHACVSNIDSHLTDLIKDDNLPIEKWVNRDLTA